MSCAIQLRSERKPRLDLTLQVRQIVLSGGNPPGGSLVSRTLQLKGFDYRSLFWISLVHTLTYPGMLSEQGFFSVANLELLSPFFSRFFTSGQCCRICPMETHRIERTGF